MPVLVVLFEVYAFIAAGLEAARAFTSVKTGPVIVHLLLALVDLAAGVVALAWPGRAGRGGGEHADGEEPAAATSIRGPREAGIRPGARATRPTCAGHCAVAGIAPRSKPVLYRFYR